ncbi:HlyC/CorC family transporter [Sphingomonas sp. ID1715]|uniref:hemolysin family protein n=1 Tax=Sphingomonas sp. ID1715 TaxID=1656898 RepID=UPI001487631A|nr:hemolysin family protein [Sphingomonas sp. ID1715]NNM76122.1 HlyC/CorC family transporter [Sphingomonas sp. ID1715]
MQPLSPFPWISVAVIFALIVLNGLFALSELAIVSARKPRLQALVKSGWRGAATALKLQENPGRLLSAGQIGITLISLLAGAFSGTVLEKPVAERLALIGISPKAAFTLVIVVTTYVSLIIGELVPKQFALRNPEPIAAVAAVPMDWFARITQPIVWLLDQSSALIFRLLRMKRETEQHVTAEELHMVVAEASRSGVIEESERAIISGVVRLADRPVREVMTPRTDIDWIDADADEETLRRRFVETPHTRVPIAEGSVDNIVGVVQSRDIVAAMIEGRPLNLRELMRPLLIVPDQVDAMDALDTLRRAEVPMVLVHDEYGHLEGLVTPADLFIAIAGHFASDQDEGTDPDLVERDDGSLLVSGSLAADTLAERLDLDLPEDRDYATTAGFVLAVMRKLPTVGEHFEEQGWRFEIVDMDGRKIDKLLVQPAGD